MALDFSSPQAYSASGGTLVNGQIPTSTAPTGTDSNSPQTGVYNASTVNVAPPSVPSTINSGSLGTDPNSGLPYKSPNPPMPSPAPVLSVTTPPLTLTPEQQQKQDLINTLMGLNTQEAGKSAYQQEQNTAQDITGKTGLLNDLTAQFNNSVRQAQNNQNQLQLDAGKGITTVAGLAPTTTGQARLDSIQQNTLASQIETAKGNLTYAQSLADKAVADKFAPIEASIAAIQANLLLIANSPQSTIDEKNQAQAQLDSVNAQKDQIAQQKQDTTDKLNLGNSYITNTLAAGKSPNAKILKAITDAPDVKTAQSILAANSAPVSPSVKAAQTYADAYATAKAQADAAVASGELSKANSAEVDKVNTALNSNKQVTDFQQIANEYGNIQNIPSTSTNPVDELSMMTSMAHLLSPGSSSLRGALNAIDVSNLQSGIWNTLNNIAKEFETKGQLSPSSMASLKELAKSQYDNGLKVYQQIRTAAIQPLINRGIKNVDDYVTDFSKVGGTGTNQSGTTPKEGDTHVYNGTTYKVVNGQWVPQ